MTFSDGNFSSKTMPTKKNYKLSVCPCYVIEMHILYMVEKLTEVAIVSVKK